LSIISTYQAEYDDIPAGFGPEDLLALLPQHVQTRYQQLDYKRRYLTRSDHKIIDDYKFHEVIDHGSKSVIWRATHLGMGQPRAIKSIFKRLVSPEQIERKLKEAKLLS